MKVYVLEEGNYEGNDLLLATEDIRVLKAEFERFIEHDARNKAKPSYELSIWEQGQCNNTYIDKEVKFFIEKL